MVSGKEHQRGRRVPGPDRPCASPDHLCHREVSWWGFPAAGGGSPPPSWLTCELRSTFRSPFALTLARSPAPAPQPFRPWPGVCLVCWAQSLPFRNRFPAVQAAGPPGQGRAVQGPGPGAVGGGVRE